MVSSARLYTQSNSTLNNMDINAAVTIRRSSHDQEEGVLHLQVKDIDSGCRFLEFTISDTDFINALRGQAEIDCKATVRGLEKIGKTQVIERFSFPIPSDWLRNKEKALELIDSVTPEGWVADKSFNSQKSFTVKDGVTYANTVIRKWVDRPE